MGCNKNLTDDQLEAMFTATDEEMQQIEQPMEYLIERTKHKCKRWTRFFSTWGAYKQHRYEPQIKKKKCPNCNKTISRANTCKVVRRPLHNLPNSNYVKWLWMDPLHWRMDPQHRRNWWWRNCKWDVNKLNIGRHLNIRVCLKVHGFHLQEELQQQLQNRHHAAIERGYP